MSYKARHAATPKYAKYVRATGASIAAMAVLTAVPAVAVEVDEPLGDVGENTPATDPAIEDTDATNTGGADTDVVDGETGTAGETDTPPAPPVFDPSRPLFGDVPQVNFGDEIRNMFATLTGNAAPAAASGPAGEDGPAAPVVKAVDLAPGARAELNTLEFHPLGALADYTFANPSELQGVHVEKDGTNIVVSADAETTPRTYTITGTAATIGSAPRMFTINVNVTGNSDAPDTGNSDAPAPKTVHVPLTIGGDFVSADGLAPAEDSVLSVTSALPKGVTKGDIGGIPTFVAAADAAVGEHPVTVTETLADGTTIEHTVVLDVQPAGTNPKPEPEPDTPAAPGGLTWEQNTTVVQNGSATVKFTGTIGETKPTFDTTAPVYAENGAQVPAAVASVDPKTGTVTLAPSWDVDPGHYTAFVTASYPGGATDTQPVNFTVTAGKYSDRYTPSVAPAYIGNDPSRVVFSKVSFGNTPTPVGTTFAVINDTHNVVGVDKDGLVTFTPNPELKPGNYTADIVVNYTTPDGAPSGTDTVRVTYSVGATYQSLSYSLVTEKTTVTRRDTATVGVPYDEGGKELPSVLHLDEGRDWPKWVTLNKDGTLTAAPDLNVKPGTYQFTSLATFPDKSTGEVKNTIVVSPGYKTQGFKYKRKDGLGAKVGRAIDKALGTEKPGSTDAAAGQPGQPGQPGTTAGDGTATTGEGDTENPATTTATPTDNMVAAPAEVTTGESAPDSTRGASALQTTGADDTGLFGAGAAAGGFALAAAAAFALRRREQDGAL